MAGPAEPYPRLRTYLEQQVEPAMAEIPAERRAVLAELAVFVAERRAQGQPVELNFICTHNSRRSQLAQVWAAAAAAWLGVEGVRAFSGGTEVTAFDLRAVEALRRAGFQVTGGEGDNPRYAVSMGPGGTLVEGWSKRYDDEANPQQGFAAIMTCGSADASCPIVSGAGLRLALTYDDPKQADGTPQEAARYDERSRQIAAQMLYLFGLAQD